jgi:succinoglycan biosynthesis protein ExoM
MTEGKLHICVCICTYKRPAFLARLLRTLAQQKTSDRFRISVRVADNDAARSAEAVIEDARKNPSLPIDYLVEPRTGIAFARNAVLHQIEADYIAMIDDDEFPQEDWLMRLLEDCEQCAVDGVLGPVLRHYEADPPAWLLKSHILERKTHATGTPIAWTEARTGNVLLHRRVLAGSAQPFRTDLKSSSDNDFFYRKIKEGFHFTWSQEAIVFETYPAQRWQRRFFLRRALLNGAMSTRLPLFHMRDALKSLIAILLYTVLLPIVAFAGQHKAMDLLFKLCFHLGRVLALLHIQVNRGAYLES